MLSVHGMPEKSSVKAGRLSQFLPVRSRTGRRIEQPDRLHPWRGHGVGNLPRGSRVILVRREIKDTISSKHRSVAKAAEQATMQLLKRIGGKLNGAGWD